MDGTPPPAEPRRGVPKRRRAEPAAAVRYARVAVPAPVRSVFTYRVPPALRPACRPGVRVVVPFGRTVVTGFVTERLARADLPSGRLRDIEEILDPDPIVSDHLLAFTRWIAEHYLASWGEVLKAAMPAGIHVRSEPGYRITPAGERALGGGGGVRIDPEERTVLERVAAAGELIRTGIGRGKGGRTRLRIADALAARGLLALGPIRIGPRVRLRTVRFLRLAPGLAGSRRRAAVGRSRIASLVLREIETAGGVLSAPELGSRLASAQAAIRRLVDAGALTEERREPEEGGPVGAVAPVAGPGLNRAQERAVASLAAGFDDRRFRVVLLRGVTGSGKTEVYLRAAAEAAARGLRTLYLVPEISLTPLLEGTIRQRFPGSVEVLHSGLPGPRRLAAWRRIRAGGARVVLGTRSAVFAPQPDLGLLVVDEEQEESYKQDESPRYHGRDAAIVRARLCGAQVVLGTATPALETHHHAATGRYELLELPERVRRGRLPEVSIVDMREEFRRRGERVILSGRLEAALRDRRARGEQSLVLLNRRGWAAFLLCRACGEPVRCSRCSISYTWHRAEAILKCHYCDRRRQPLSACPSCGSGHLHFGAEGTEQVEERIRGILPGVKLARMDRDTVTRRGRSAEILRSFEAGDIEVLLGTQMIAKGHHFPRVTLVGVLSADHLLAFPDFRAGERTYQLLTQVAGRAGRGDRPGEVVIQAFHTEHYALRAVRDHDPALFYDRELHYRQVMRYPPFSVLAALIVRHRDPRRALADAKRTGRRLEALGEGKVRILGPALAPLARLRGEYRYQILLKAQRRGRLRAVLDGLLGELPGLRLSPRRIVVDVDPLSTM